MFKMSQGLLLGASCLSRFLSEAAETRCDMHRAIKLLDTPQWSEARTRRTKALQVRATCDKGTPYG
jgi:hypothetical protein